MVGTLGEARVPLRPLTLKVRRCPLMVPRVGEGVIVSPSRGAAVDQGIAGAGAASRASVCPGGSGTIGLDLPPEDPLAQPGWD